MASTILASRGGLQEHLGYVSFIQGKFLTDEDLQLVGGPVANAEEVARSPLGHVNNLRRHMLKLLRE